MTLISEDTELGILCLKFLSFPCVAWERGGLLPRNVVFGGIMGCQLSDTQSPHTLSGAETLPSPLTWRGCAGLGYYGRFLWQPQVSARASISRNVGGGGKLTKWGGGGASGGGEEDGGDPLPTPKDVASVCGDRRCQSVSQSACVSAAALSCLSEWVCVCRRVSQRVSHGRGRESWGGGVHSLMRTCICFWEKWRFIGESVGFLLSELLLTAFGDESRSHVTWLAPQLSSSPWRQNNKWLTTPFHFICTFIYLFYCYLSSGGLFCSILFSFFEFYFNTIKFLFRLF